MADDQLIAHSVDNGFSLDVILFFGRKQNWPSQNGGFISYFSSGEEDEIIRVIPTLNTAAIVFRFFFEFLKIIRFKNFLFFLNIWVNLN